jgi:hypothetical protein
MGGSISTLAAAAALAQRDAESFLECLPTI